MLPSSNFPPDGVLFASISKAMPVVSSRRGCAIVAEPDCPVVLGC